MNALIRSAAPLLVLAAAVFVAAWIGRVSEGRKSLAEADAALIRGDRIDAIVFARAAAEARCPLCSAPAAGFAKLESIAHDAEAKSDDATSLTAWRAVRSATLAATWFDDSEPRREHADAEIARLSHRVDALNAATGNSASPAAAEEKLRAVLAPSPLPSTMVFVVVALGAALLLTGALRSVRAKSLRAQDLAIAAAGAAVAVLGVVAF